jgi:hypothetical protein
MEETDLVLLQGITRTYLGVCYALTRRGEMDGR